MGQASSRLARTVGAVRYLPTGSCSACVVVEQAKVFVARSSC
jgi:hypothetical protein